MGEHNWEETPRTYSDQQRYPRAVIAQEAEIPRENPPSLTDTKPQLSSVMNNRGQNIQETAIKPLKSWAASQRVAALIFINISYGIKRAILYVFHATDDLREGQAGRHCHWTHRAGIFCSIWGATQLDVGLVPFRWASPAPLQQCSAVPAQVETILISN